MKQLMPQPVLTLETSLVGVVKSFTYARNHHWAKLKDHKNREITLVENAVVRYVCAACSFWMVSEINIGNGATCPSCRAPSLQTTWMKPQVALIPEEESPFEMPTKHNADLRAEERDALNVDETK